MKSLQRRFNNIKVKKPLWSSYLCFAEAVNKQNFSKSTIRRWFNQLVEKDDFARSDKKAILAHLNNLSDPLRTIEIDSKSTL